jgi:hypothetical protein
LEYDLDKQTLIFELPRLMNPTASEKHIRDLELMLGGSRTHSRDDSHHITATGEPSSTPEPGFHVERYIIGRGGNMHVLRDLTPGTDRKNFADRNYG